MSRTFCRGRSGLTLSLAARSARRFHILENLQHTRRSDQVYGIRLIIGVQVEQRSSLLSDPLRETQHRRRKRKLS